MTTETGKDIDVLLDTYAAKMGLASQKDIPIDQFVALCAASVPFAEKVIERTAGALVRRVP